MPGQDLSTNSGTDSESPKNGRLCKKEFNLPKLELGNERRKLNFTGTSK
jgi:hypothetical protein